MMKKIILTTIILMLFSCQEKKIEFTYLEKLSKKTISSYDSKEGGNVYMYAEEILMSNAPKDIYEARKIQEKYFKEHKKICSLDSTISIYKMTFYNKTSCTEYFIGNEEDPGGFSSNMIDDCQEAYQSFYYERDKNNPNRWISNMRKERNPIEYHDTIYCK